MDRVDLLLMTSWTGAGVLASLTVKPVVAGVTAGIGVSGTVANIAWHRSEGDRL